MSHDYIPEFYQSTVKSSVELMNVCLTGIQRLQKYQAEAIDDFRAVQSEMTKQLGAVHSPGDWQSAQTELVRQQIETATGYWKGLYANACQNQVDILREGQAKVKEMSADLNRKLETVPAEAQPVVSALKQVIGVAESTCAAAVRATEEMVRLSAVQFDAANASTVDAARQTKAKRAA